MIHDRDSINSYSITTLLFLAKTFLYYMLGRDGSLYFTLFGFLFGEQGFSLNARTENDVLVSLNQFMPSVCQQLSRHLIFIVVYKNLRTSAASKVNRPKGNLFNNFSMKKLNRHVFNQKCESSLKFEALNVRQSYEKIANASIRSVIRGLLKLFIHIVPAVY